MSSEIESVIKMIADIASQTNLLLNASIEAKVLASKVKALQWLQQKLVHLQFSQVSLQREDS